MFTSICILFFIFGTVMFIGFSAEMRKLYAQIPSPSSIQEVLNEHAENSFLYDRHGTLLYTFKDPDLDREYLEVSEISSLVKLATLAAEDKDFYLHHGIDYIASLRGAITSSIGDKVIGGSTITQQLAKNTFLTAEVSLERKIKEGILSAVIESQYDKDTILQLYLNTVTFGSRVTGLKTAAQVYFSKDIKDLNLNELAFLISIVQNPNELSPIYSYDQQRAWELNNERRYYILNQIKTNYDFFASTFSDIPSREEIDEYLATDIKIKPKVNQIKAPHFVFYVQSIISKAPYNISQEDLYRGGYRIYSTLDYNMQKIAEKEIKINTQRYGGQYGFSNSALISIEPSSGDILVMQGSKDYFGKKDKSGRFDPQVNVIMSTQNLGSSLKPFLAYMAFDKGLYSRYSSISDSPETFQGGYKPKNVDGRFLGTMSIDRALKYSRNLPFVKILDRVGVSNFNKQLANLGYTNVSKGTRYGLAAALGGVSETVFDHAFAYTALANKGVQPDPRPIFKIVDKDGKAREFEVKRDKVLNSGAVAEVNSILGDKSFTTDNHWMVSLSGAYKFAGKTGTTDSNKQNYYIGYGPNILTLVWVGNNNNAGMRGDAFGSTTALPIWYNYTRAVLNKYPKYAVRGSY